MQSSSLNGYNIDFQCSENVKYIGSVKIRYAFVARVCSSVVSKEQSIGKICDFS